MTWGVIIAAGGSGERFGDDKLFVTLGGMPLISHAITLFGSLEPSVICVVAPAAKWPDVTHAAAAVGVEIALAEGGSTRQESVSNGLQKMGDVDLVVVHDAARPLCPKSVVQAVIAAAQATGAATAALPIVDALISAEAERMTGTVPRQGVYRVHTPQAFRRELLIEAHASATRLARTADDDAGLVAALGAEVALVPSDFHNVKVTYSRDLGYAEALLGVGHE